MRECPKSGVGRVYYNEFVFALVKQATVKQAIKTANKSVYSEDAGSIVANRGKPLCLAMRTTRSAFVSAISCG